MFKPHIIIYLQRNGLLIAGRHVASAKLAFPESVVQNLEVIDRSKLIELCREFFLANKLHGKRVLLILDYSVVFEKSIELDKTGQPDKLIEGFVAAMPFSEGQRACIGVENGSSLHLFAANAALYNAVGDALEVANVGSPAAVVPIAAYKLGDQERTVVAATEKILKDSAVSKQANLRSVVPA